MSLADSSPLRILVVDDQDMQRLIVRRKVEKLGHRVVEARDGLSALQMLTEQPVDMVISDWVMDGMDGTQLCRTLRSRTDLPYVYFILMSSRDAREDLLTGLSAGADDFLRKPLDFDELAVRIRGGQRLLALQSSLSVRNQQLHDALAHINADIHAAGEFQKAMLPRAALDSHRSRMAWLFLPSSRVSGDAINGFRLDENHIGFYNVDVAGHGVAAAMVGMLMTQSLDPRSTGCVLRLQGPDGQVRITPPAQALAALNRQMTSLELGSNYLTCTYGVLDERSGDTVLVRAGHTMPVIVRADGTAEVLEEEGDMPVGLFDFADYHHLHCRLAPGDRLCLYSDGVTECESPQEEEYGVERLAAYLSAHQHEPIKSITHAFHHEMRRWSGSDSDAFKDDVSMLVIERAPANGAGPTPAV
jgi:sigma-B regulation protein RsbU (phosphoserine phosphatase)